MTAIVNPLRNAILASLSQGSRRELLSEMRFVQKLPMQIGEPTPLPADHCYFLASGLVCHLAFADSYIIETGIVGCDGLFGFPAVAGIKQSPLSVMVQYEASGWSIPAERLTEWMSDKSIRSSILKYHHCLRVQLQQTAACNARHPVRERLLRWLLLAHDRVGARQVSVTQEELGQKLGARRQLVSEITTELADRGAIESGRGWINIANRRTALSMACGCYNVISDEYERVLSFRRCSEE